MSEDTDSDVGTPDPSVPQQQQPRTPAIDEKLAATILTKYHRFKGVLDDNEHVQITHFTVEEDFEAADTALSDIYLLKLAYQLPKESGERTLDLVAKQLPQDPFARIFVKEAQFDLREIKFYTKIVPDMVEFVKDCLPDQPAEKQLPIPKCYYPISDDDDDAEIDAAAETILVLEDLKAHDYRSPSFSDGLTLEEASLALEAIARMHALSLGMRVSRRGGGAATTKSLNEIYPFLFQTDKATNSYEMLLNRGLPQLHAFLEDKGDMLPILNSMMNFGNEMKNIISSLLSPRGPIALLTHTDFWCNNLLFRRDRRHCIILDWQMVTYSRPTNDVALLIISSLAPELRREHKNLLLDTYWKALTSFALKVNVDIEGVLGYTRSDLQEDYRKSQLLAILLCIGSVDVAIGNAKAEQRLIEVLRDLHAEKMFTQQSISQCINS